MHELEKERFGDERVDRASTSGTWMYVDEIEVARGSAHPESEQVITVSCVQHYHPIRVTKNSVPE